jgi:hypothetical protein
MRRGPLLWRRVYGGQVSRIKNDKFDTIANMGTVAISRKPYILGVFRRCGWIRRIVDRPKCPDFVQAKVSRLLSGFRVLLFPTGFALPCL